MENLINKYIKRIKIDYPEDDKLMIDLQAFAKELKEQWVIDGISGSALDRQEVLKIATELTNRVPDKIHRSDRNDMEHIKSNLKAAIILQLRKMHYR